MEERNFLNRDTPVVDEDGDIDLGEAATAADYDGNNALPPTPPGPALTIPSWCRIGKARVKADNKPGACDAFDEIERMYKKI